MRCLIALINISQLLELLQMIDVKIDNKDIRELQQKIKKLAQIDKSGLGNEIGKTAAFINYKAERALAAANFDQSKGGLIQGQDFGYDKASKTATIENTQNYAPFIEFGTRYKKIELEDLKALGLPVQYAAQFKASPLKKATNITAKPFFFPSVRFGMQKLLLSLRKRLNNAIK